MLACWRLCLPGRYDRFYSVLVQGEWVRKWESDHDNEKGKGIRTESKAGAGRNSIFPEAVEPEDRESGKQRQGSTEYLEVLNLPEVQRQRFDP